MNGGTRIALALSLLVPALAVDAAAADAGARPALGAPCEQDADCGDARLLCLTASSTELGGRGPAGGLCTAHCKTNSDCSGLDPQASCLYFSDPTKSYCFEGCEQSADYQPGFDPKKCHGRPDVACNGAERGLTAMTCLPICTGDAQCGTGLSCNGEQGLCQSDAISGDPVGSTCDPTVKPSTCQGYCSQYANGASYCTAYCIFGETTGCGFSGSGQPGAACLSKMRNGGDSVGDLGLCQELCNCDSDCHATGFVCSPSALAGSMGARGGCVPSDYVPASIPTCTPPSDLGACVYGLVRACHGTGGCLGAAECLPSRAGYGPCVCPDAGGAPDAATDAGQVIRPPHGDGGGTPADAGDRVPPGEVDSGKAGAAVPPVTGRTPPSGCSCRAAASPASPPWALGVAMALCAGALARRRVKARSRD